MTESPIYYMRDNHTFKRLSNDVSAALVEIEQKFNEGWTHGSLCSKRDGFPMVHANGSNRRLEFFAKCKEVLEVALKQQPAAQWVEVEEIKLQGDKLMAKLREKNGGKA